MTELVRGFRGKLGDSLDVSQPMTVKMLTAGGAVYDTCCFGVDAGDKLSDDRYMVFYNQTASPGGEIVYSGSGEASEYTVKLGALPQSIAKLVFTVSIDGEGTMGQIQSHIISICQNGAEVMRLTLGGKDFQNEKAIIGVEIYLKTVWRIAVVAGGFNGGLSDLLANYGGELADEPAEAAAAPAPQQFGQQVPPPPALQQFGQQVPPPPMPQQFGQQVAPPPVPQQFGQQAPPPPVQQQFGQQAPPTPMPQQFGQQAPPPTVPQQFGQQVAPPPMPQQFGQQVAPSPVPQQFGQQAPPTPMPQQFGQQVSPPPAPQQFGQQAPPPPVPQRFSQQAYEDRPFSEPVPLRAPSGMPECRPAPFEVTPLPPIPPVPRQINNYQTVPVSQALMSMRVELKPESYDTRPLPQMPQTARGTQFNYDTRPV